jgi:hypothetical protein
MHRRGFIGIGLGGSLMTQVPASGANEPPRYIELRRIQLRNTQDAMAQRAQEYLSKSYIPALKRAGATTVGAFSNLIGENSPYLLLASEFPDAQTWAAASREAELDKETTAGRKDYYGGGLQFVRMEVSLLRGFTTMPRMVRPASDAGKTHVFELRVYESNNPQTLARKVRMFDEGEIALFRKLNMTPVFFGETIAGRNMPNLTYLLAFDDLAAREKAWSTFASHPEWDKMKQQPGVSDAEIVSNISNAILRATSYSDFR